jgi:hypothetical protein
MKTKWLAFIFGGVACTLLVICVVLGFALYQKYKEKPNLPKLPALQVETLQKATKEFAAQKGSREAGVIAPYYSVPFINYAYNLIGEFPSLPQKLMVYKTTPETFDLNSAKDLALKFDFKGEPKTTDGNFTFSEGTTPSATILKEESIEGSTGVGTEPSSPSEEPEKFTGREFSITKEGYLNYQDYSVERKEVVASEDEEIKSSPPQGVESKEKAKEIATNFLKDKGFLPESYDIDIPDPYGSYFISLCPKYQGYRVEAGTITIEVGNDGKIASLSLRKVKIENWEEYPIKNKDEALKIETIEYKIEKVELGYSSSFDKEGKEYLQPVYVLSGKDSSGNSFKFGIPAIKSEFLEQIEPEPVPLTE